MNSIVQLDHVTRSFGSKLALNDVSLKVDQGTVLGLVGENGSGKTTILKHVLGLLKPNTGTVSVFGMDPARQPVPVLAQIGYLSEEDILPGWMRGYELQRYMQGFYPTWDQEYADQLAKEFRLDLYAKLSTLSKGQRARAGLMAALAYRPPLIVLDEPSSGLDPIVRHDILSVIVRTIAEEGRTVILSSHHLAEVDRLADNVALVKNGEIALYDALDTLKEEHIRCTLVYEKANFSMPIFKGLVSISGSGREWTALSKGTPELLREEAERLGARVIDQRSASLDEIFVGYSRPTNGASR